MFLENINTHIREMNLHKTKILKCYAQVISWLRRGLEGAQVMWKVGVFVVSLFYMLACFLAGASSPTEFLQALRFAASLCSEQASWDGSRAQHCIWLALMNRRAFSIVTSQTAEEQEDDCIGLASCLVKLEFRKHFSYKNTHGSESWS